MVLEENYFINGSTFFDLEIKHLNGDRMKISLENITAQGFQIRINNWENSEVYGVGVSWRASR